MDVWRPGCTVYRHERLDREKDPVSELRGSNVSNGPGKTARPAAVSFKPADVKILGDLDYGQTSGVVNYATTSRYRAFFFSGYGNERVEITTAGARSWVALADSSLNLVASSNGARLSVALPYHGPDLEVWYIVFREAEVVPAGLRVQVKKIEQTVQNVEPAIAVVAGEPK
jgi:hypothetical protein